MQYAIRADVKNLFSTRRNIFSPFFTAVYVVFIKSLIKRTFCIIVRGVVCHFSTETVCMGALAYGPL